MAYRGQTFTIPLGGLGLMTDDVQNRLPLGALIEADNVILGEGRIEKAPGAWRWNRSAEASGIVALTDFWPSPVAQRVFTVTRDGLVRKWSDREAVTTITAEGAAPTTLSLTQGTPPKFVAGGAEDAGDPRKLFLFSGSNQVQVISGDGTTRSNITNPAADWATSFPNAGVMHRNRLVAWGNENDPHRIYLSDPADHETFTGISAVQFPIFPGEGEGVLSCEVFKGRLFIFKYPQGAYFLEDSSFDVADWSIRKLSSTFGAASTFSAFSVLNDLFVANSTGSVTQLSATEKFGDVESGDLFRNLRTESYLKGKINRSVFASRTAIYYEDRKWAMITYQSQLDTKPDLIALIDFQDPEFQRVTWLSAFQPNCLTLMKDTLGDLRPIYGAEDGYIYRMDWETREVESENAIEAVFQTAHTDFSASDPGLAERMKLYDFLEVTFEQTGEWNLDVDVFIDQQYSETLSFNLNKGTRLGQFPLGVEGGNPSYSVEGGDAVDRGQQSFRLPLHGTGRRISFRCRNAGLRENFKLTALTVGFRLAGNAQKA